MDEKFIKKLVVAGIAMFLVLVVCIQSCSIIDPTERGVTITLGQVKEVLEPGMHFKVPFVTHVKTYDITPIAYGPDDMDYNYILESYEVNTEKEEV